MLIVGKVTQRIIIICGFGGLSMYIEITGLSKNYHDGENIINALKEVQIFLEKGTFTMIIGPSGGGKTTLLNILGLLDEPSEGTVKIDGTIISDLKKEERTIYRRDHIGYIFQEYNLVESLNVNENIILTTSLAGKNVEEKEVESVTKKLGIFEKLKSFPGTLSGGQRQRVAIARSIITNPNIILADEPTGNLDTKSGTDVMELLKMAVCEFNQTVIMVTHNMNLLSYANNVIEIIDGQVNF